MSCACCLASRSRSSVRLAACSRSCLPRSPAASPSAICFWRVSTARISGGHMNLAVNQMNAAKVSAWASSVKLMFIIVPFRDLQPLLDHRQQRVGKREKQPDAEADNERRVDQPQQQEHF